MQRIEHYEIAAYATDVALAKALGEKEVADLLSETLEEEKQTDLKLTEMTHHAGRARRRGRRRRWRWGWSLGRASESRLRSRPFLQAPGEPDALRASSTLA